MFSFRFLSVSIRKSVSKIGRIRRLNKSVLKRFYFLECNKKIDFYWIILLKKIDFAANYCVTHFYTHLSNHPSVYFSDFEFVSIFEWTNDQICLKEEIAWGKVEWFRNQKLHDPIYRKTPYLVSDTIFVFFVLFFKKSTFDTNCSQKFFKPQNEKVVREEKTFCFTS